MSSTKYFIVCALLACLLPCRGQAQNSDGYLVIIEAPPSSLPYPGTCDLGCTPDALEPGEIPDGTTPNYTPAQSVVVNVYSRGEFLVTFRKRTCTNSGNCYLDYRIDEIKFLGQRGVDPYEQLNMACILNEIGEALLRKETPNPLPVPTSSGCSQLLWRTVHSKCWKRHNTGNSACAVYYAPCADESCCITTYHLTPIYVTPIDPGGQNYYVSILISNIGETVGDFSIICEDPPLECESSCDECSAINQE